jgi:sugar phosphate isomerase/epimerase
MPREPHFPTLSRRDFLRGAALAVAAGCARVTIANPPSGSKKVLVGAHPWVYAATQPGYDITPVLEGIFADMSYAGLDGIELMHTALRPDDAVERIAALGEKHKLPVIGSSFGGNMWNRPGLDEALADARVVVPRLAKLGGRTLGVSVGAAGHAKTAEELDIQAEGLRTMIALCNDHGVVLNLHNHTYEVENNLHDLRGTLERIPDVKLGPDLNWLVRGGVDPVDFIRRYGKSIVFLHLRDQQADGAWSEALGEGDMDYAAIAGALQEIGFAGDAVIELAHERNFKPTRPLRDSLKLSRQFVRQTLGY